MISSSFTDIFRHPSPALAAQFCKDSDETPTTVTVEHVLGTHPSPAGLEFLNTLSPHKPLSEFVAFYRDHDGVEFCRTFDSRFDEIRPLLEFKTAEGISEFTARYSPGGDLAWTMDLNKSKSLYRGSAPWIAFAEIDSGPACLTTFLSGENAAFVFYATPQPEFNILRPIAKGFDALLERIATDIPAFLRLIRVTVTLEGADGDNYGLVPIEYTSGN